MRWWGATAAFQAKAHALDLLEDRPQQLLSIDARGRFTRLFKQVKQLWEILLEHRFPPLLNNLSEVAGDGMNRHLSLAGKKAFSLFHVMSLHFCNEDMQVSLHTPEEF